MFKKYQKWRFLFIPWLLPCLLFNSLICLFCHTGAWNEDLRFFFALNQFGPASWTIGLSESGLCQLSLNSMMNSSCIRQQKAKKVIVCWSSAKAWNRHSFMQPFFKARQSWWIDSLGFKCWRVPGWFKTHLEFLFFVVARRINCWDIVVLTLKSHTVDFSLRVLQI